LNDFAASTSNGKDGIPAPILAKELIRGPQQSEEQHTDYNPKRGRLVARIKLEVRL